MPTFGGELAAGIQVGDQCIGACSRGHPFGEILGVDRSSVAEAPVVGA